MKQIVINGNKTLSGTIKISGAKNSAVALIPAAILSDSIVKIDNVPNISDVVVLEQILKYLGAKVEYKDSLMIIDSSNIENKPIPEEMSSKLRASYYFMSALLGKFNNVSMHFPGGCSIGARPIDQTLKGYENLGAKVEEKEDFFTVSAKKLVGNHIYLDMASVGATINIIISAVKAEGQTIIENAAKEPEIVNLSSFLNNMGARIKGAGTSQITIDGVSKLGNCYIEVIPDRIEAGTYIIAGALCGDNLEITNLIPEHIDALIMKLKEMGVKIDIEDDKVIVSKSTSLKSVNIKTLGYPGFATDLQQPLTPLLTQCTGKSRLEETIYENRFKHIPYLIDMGAKIETLSNRIIEIKGPTKLHGSHVCATDLRSGACMVLAGLLADGTTLIDNVEFVLRGYENIIEKLSNVGAVINLKEI